MGMLDSEGPLTGYPSSNRMGPMVMPPQPKPGLSISGAQKQLQQMEDITRGTPSTGGMQPAGLGLPTQLGQPQPLNSTLPVQEPPTQQTSFTGLTPDQLQGQQLQRAFLDGKRQQTFEHIQQVQQGLPPMLSGSGLGSLGGGGQQNLNLGQVGLTFSPSGQGGGKGGGQDKGYAG